MKIRAAFWKNVLATLDEDAKNAVDAKEFLAEARRRLKELRLCREALHKLDASRKKAE